MDANLVNSVLVTGDHNVVVVGKSPSIQLTLIPAARRKLSGPIDPDREIDLLNPFRQAIPLVGRDKDIESLVQ